MTNIINSLEKYLLEHYDKAGGTIGVVDPSEREEFFREELRSLQPDLNSLGALQADSEAIERLFNAWVVRPKFQAPYLSDLQLGQFKAELFSKKEADFADTAIIHLGDQNVSASKNSEETVQQARQKGDVPREGTAFKVNDLSRPVKFTIKLKSVSAFVHSEQNKTRSSSAMLSPDRVYIVPEGYKGSAPPSPQEMADWHKDAKWPNMSVDPAVYFLEIIPGATSAKESKISKKGYMDFTYDVEMPPGSYEVHAVAGEFVKNGKSDFDNFDTTVTVYNAKADAGRKPSAIALRPDEDAGKTHLRPAEDEVKDLARGKDDIKTCAIPEADVPPHCKSLVSALLSQSNTVEGNKILDEIMQRESCCCSMDDIIRSSGMNANKMDKLRKLASEGQDGANRLNVAHTLLEYDYAWAIGAIKMIMQDNKVRFKNRFRAAMRLALMVGDKDALDFLNNLPPEFDIWVRTDDLNGLMSLGEAGKNIVNKIARHPKCDRYTRNEVIEAIARFDKEMAVETLKYVIQNYKEGVDVIALTHILASLGYYEDAIHVLHDEAMGSDEPTDLIKELIAAGPKGVEAVYDLALNAKSHATRIEAAKAVIPLGHEDAIRLLHDEAMGSDESTDLIKELIAAGPKGVEAVYDLALNAKSHATRIEAAKAVIPLGYEDAIHVLHDEAMGSDKPTDLIKELIAAGPKGVDAARDMAFNAKSPTAQLIAAKAVISHDKDRIDALIAQGQKVLDAVRDMAFNAKNPTTQLIAARALLYYDQNKAASALWQALNASGKDCGSILKYPEALEVLLHLDQYGTVNMLRECLTDSNVNIQIAAAKLLLPYDKMVAVTLLKRIRDNYPSQLFPFAAEARRILSSIGE